jgi:hypothetical protein
MPPVQAIVLFLEGKPRAALEAMESARGTELLKLWCRADAYYDLGNAKESDAALKVIEAKYAHTAPEVIAELHGRRGEVDAAFVWLERAREQQDNRLLVIAWNPLMKNIGNDPRYAAFAKSINLPIDSVNRR